MAEEAKAQEELELSEKVKGILDSIKELTVLELVQLVKALEKEFGVSAVPVAAGAPAAAPGTAPAGEEAKEEEKKVKVVLKEAGPNKIQVIKVIRQILPNLGIKEAKEFVESAPKVIKEDITPDEAKSIKEQLEKIGAKVEIS